MRRDDASVAGNEGEGVGRLRGTKKSDEVESRLMDREVPLAAGAGHAALHDWLDGELEQSRARDAEGASQVELWTRINAESEMLRRRTTPMYVHKAIMSALPDEAPSTVTRWTTALGTKPGMLMIVAAAVIAAGALALVMMR